MKDDNETKDDRGISTSIKIFFLSLALLIFTAIFAGLLFFILSTYEKLIPQTTFPEIPGIALGLTALTIGGFVLAYFLHRIPALPLYLLSTLLMALTVYGALAALPVYLVMATTRAVSPNLARVLLTLLTAGTFFPVIGGLIHARFLKVRELDIEVDGSKENVTIAFLSDLHLGLLVGKGRLKKILSILKERAPDIIIIGGDLYDTKPEFVGRTTPLLRRLANIAPTYAVTGNHEYIHGVEECVSHMRSAGIRVVRNDTLEDRETGIRITGVDDTSGQSGEGGTGTKKADVEQVLFRGRGEGVRIFVSHAPLYFRQAAETGVDLQLSGHTHGGQMFPIGLITRAIYREGDRGWHDRYGSHLLVSTGAGTWGPPVRVGTSSELHLIRLKGG